MAGVEGLEPSRTVLETAMLPITSNPYMATSAGFDPATSSVTGWRSPD